MSELDLKKKKKGFSILDPGIAETGSRMLTFLLLDCRNFGILHVMLRPGRGSHSLATLDIFTK